jgi:hypothetical protein
MDQKSHFVEKIVHIFFDADLAIQQKSCIKIPQKNVFWEIHFWEKKVFTQVFCKVGRRVFLETISRYHPKQTLVSFSHNFPCF